ncbi:FmdE family protein [Desulforhopalus sp. 52FAK]
MSADTILQSDLFQKCLDFHGHLCPGLSLGYQASMAGMSWLEARRAEDEEVVAIVENDACGVDAIQVITGCTFGKGNFIYRDYGKTAFSFFSRETGKGVRIARRPDPDAALDPEHMQLMDKIREATATKEERKRFRTLHDAVSKRILAKKPEEIFTVTELTVALPDKARIEPSINCDRCGEPTMSTKLRKVNEQRICGGCL